MNIIATRLEDFAVSGIIDGIFFFPVHITYRDGPTFISSCEYL